MVAFARVAGRGFEQCDEVVAIGAAQTNGGRCACIDVQNGKDEI
jgi:hypothetical protein